MACHRSLCYGEPPVPPWLQGASQEHQPNPTGAGFRAGSGWEGFSRIFSSRFSQSKARKSKQSQAAVTELCLPHRTTLAPRSCVRWPGTWAGLTPGTRATSTPCATSSPSWPPWYGENLPVPQKHLQHLGRALCPAGLSMPRLSPTNPPQVLQGSPCPDFPLPRALPGGARVWHCPSPQEPFAVMFWGFFFDQGDRKRQISRKKTSLKSPQLSFPGRLSHHWQPTQEGLRVGAAPRAQLIPHPASSQL